MAGSCFLYKTGNLSIRRDNVGLRRSLRHELVILFHVKHIDTCIDGYFVACYAAYSSGLYQCFGGTYWFHLQSKIAAFTHSNTTFSSQL
jgi:hypothetical protein